MTPRSGSSDGEPSDGVEPDGERVDGWPVDLAGVTETVVATLGPNERWNHAALGVHEPSDGSATARTWGRTRTRRNLEERGDAYVQFTRDPVDFVEAALGVYETEEPILERSDAWTRVDATSVDRTDDAGTEVVEWRLDPVHAAVRERVVPTTNRGRAAVVEATVAASRLDVEAYDESELLDRLSWLADVVDRCGSTRDAAAFERIGDLTGWQDQRQ